MSRDIIFSAVLHIIFVGIVLVSSPFKLKGNVPFDEIIRVQLTAPSEIKPSEPVALEPVSIPEPVFDEPVDIPISDPKTMKEAKLTPKEKPKPKKTESKPKTQKQTGNSQKSGNTNNGDSKEIKTGGGSPFAGATIDNASFDYPYWFTQAFNKIASNFRNTFLYDGTLVCVVYFQVIKSGRVLELRVENSSGFSEFDAVCIRAVESSKPFPPLPDDFRDEIIGITLPFKSN